jgi:uncharacterized protein (TIGR02270 family)
MSTLSEGPERPCINEIVEQYLEEGSFLWMLRTRQVNAPNISLKQLADLDERMEAQIDGLRSSGGSGWRVCQDSLESAGPGDVFIAGILALESGDPARISALSDMALSMPPLARAMVSALAWSPYALVEPHIANLLESKSPGLQFLGIGATALHRRDPGEHLLKAVNSNDMALRSRALRAAGELGRVDLLPPVREAMAADEEPCRCAAAWSAALLGDSQDALSAFESVATVDSPAAVPAITATFRRMHPPVARELHLGLMRKRESSRTAILCAAARGMTDSVDWLLEQMQIPQFARVAGEAFSAITGLNLGVAPFEGTPPCPEVQFGPSEDPDDANVDMDVDEDLPWPDPQAVAEWWQAHRADYRCDGRYLAGHDLSLDWLGSVLRTGRQKQRYAAALELKMCESNVALFEVRAPAPRQRELLGLAP